MNQLFTSSKAPFLRFVRIMNIGCIYPSEFKRYYLKRLEEAGIPANPELISKLLNLTQGHPFYSSLFLQLLLNEPKLTSLNTDKAFESATEQISNPNGRISKMYGKRYPTVTNNGL